jgi:putative transposase
MPASITLTAAERNALLGHYRRAPSPDWRLRAHVLLLLADGWAWATITAVLYTSSSTIARWQRRFRQGRLAAVFPAGPPRRRVSPWVAVVVRWVLELAPADFGFARSRWSCEAVAVVLAEDHGVPVSRETVRRWLREAGLVWRRPRPTLRPRDPRRAQILAALRRLLRGLPDDEAAVFLDEVELNTNPKVGCMWMRRGRQAAVGTPGTNEKRVLAGSIHWRTGRVILTGGLPKEGRTAALFCRHLDDLRRAFRHYRVIHVICDNARTHKPEKSRLVKEYLGRWGHRVVLHYLPTYAPECNPIERVWWRLHDQVTRNHRCHTMEELLDLTFQWLGDKPTFALDRRVYQQPATKNSLPPRCGVI